MGKHKTSHIVLTMLNTTHVMSVFHDLHRNTDGMNIHHHYHHHSSNVVIEDVSEKSGFVCQDATILACNTINGYFLQIYSHAILLIPPESGGMLPKTANDEVLMVMM